jgi:hypothetical protein
VCTSQRCVSHTKIRKARCNKEEAVGMTKIVLYTKVQNVMDKWLKKEERHISNRVFPTRQGIKDTMENHIKDGSASFEIQNI